MIAQASNFFGVCFYVERCGDLVYPENVARGGSKFTERKFFTVNFNIDKKTPDLSISVSANTIRKIGDAKMAVGMEKIRVDDDSDGVLIFNAQNTRHLEEAKGSHLLNDAETEEDERVWRVAMLAWASDLLNDAETEEDEKYEEYDDDDDDDEYEDEDLIGLLNKAEDYEEEHEDEDEDEDEDEGDDDLISIRDYSEKTAHLYDQITKYTQDYLQPGDGYVWVKVGDLRVDGDEFHTINYSAIKVDSLGNLISIEYNWHSATAGHQVMFAHQIRRRISR